MIFTAGHGDGFDIQPEVVLLLVCAVAFIAVLLENGTNLAHEIDGEDGRGGEGDETERAHAIIHTAELAVFHATRARDIHTSPSLRALATAPVRVLTSSFS